MTSEEARRESGRKMESDRQALGRSMEEARRASGRAMRDDMRALAESNRLQRTLPVLSPKGGMSAQRGRADWIQTSSQTGGGIDSPLTEIAMTREYYDSPNLSISNTFLQAFEIRMLKKITFEDAAKRPVVMNFTDRVRDFNV